MSTISNNQDEKEKDDRLKENSEKIGSYWEYSVFVRLTKEELDMFANKKVDSFRIYIYEGKPINKKSILQTMGYARAINI